jgi:hypothetical protein
MDPAPGLGDGAVWVAVDGTVGVPAGHAGTLEGQATVVINPVTGRAVLSDRQAGRLTLTADPKPVVLTGATVSGELSGGPNGFSGTLSGTGQVTVGTPEGGLVAAHAALRTDSEGALLVAFPLDP